MLKRVASSVSDNFQQLATFSDRETIPFNRRLKVVRGISKAKAAAFFGSFKLAIFVGIQCQLNPVFFGFSFHVVAVVKIQYDIPSANASLLLSFFFASLEVSRLA